MEAWQLDNGSYSSAESRLTLVQQVMMVLFNVFISRRDAWRLWQGLIASDDLVTVPTSEASLLSLAVCGLMVVKGKDDYERRSR